MRYVALLRGINVGGHGRLAMGDLRGLLGALGHADVTTYLQSGNAVFTSDREDAEEIRAEIEGRIASDLGMGVKVLIRKPEEIAAVVRRNPFLEATATPKLLHVSFLSAQPSAEHVAALDPQQFAPDTFHVGDRAVYMRYAERSHDSKVSNDLWERRFGVTATARNWNTVTKLLEMATAG